jgi:LacI family transcriptional regulator
MKRIGIQLDFAGSYGRGVLRGVMQYANLQRDWEFLMPPMYSLKSKKTVDPATADGVIAMIHSMRSIEPFARAGVPVVNTARTLSIEEMASQGLPTIVPDDAEIARMAFRYFAERGFRTFGFCGHPTASWSRVRCQAFEDCCVAGGGSFSAAAAVDRVPERWIKSLPRPCAILAANDRYAWHAIDACREINISVPEEIAVLGVDNDTLLAEMISPTLSSIDLAAERIGFLAAETLDRLMKQGRSVASGGKTAARANREAATPAAAMEVKPAAVITRRSTDVLSIADEAVGSAVRYIREHAISPIGVDDVLDHVAMSRRNLERRFKRAMGRSLLDEIRRVRLDRACQLLRDTDLDMLRIAHQSGFAGQVRFSTVFREAMKQTPTEYRRAHRPDRV